MTVLFPFVPAADTNEDVVAAVTAHFSSFTPFEAELAAVGSFESFVWLAPTPRSRFLDLIEATCERFPDYPPYEGTITGTEPHLTIASVVDGESIDPLMRLAEAELGPHLPFRFAVSRVSLFVERADGTWDEAHHFLLG